MQLHVSDDKHGDDGTNRDSGDIRSLFSVRTSDAHRSVSEQN
jgi:hypothetical protein